MDFQTFWTWEHTHQYCVRAEEPSDEFRHPTFRLARPGSQKSEVNRQSNKFTLVSPRVVKTQRDDIGNSMATRNETHQSVDFSDDTGTNLNSAQLTPTLEVLQSAWANTATHSFNKPAQLTLSEA